MLGWSCPSLSSGTAQILSIGVRHLAVGEVRNRAVPGNAVILPFGGAVSKIYFAAFYKLVLRGSNTWEKGYAFEIVCGISSESHYCFMFRGHNIYRVLTRLFHNDEWKRLKITVVQGCFPIIWQWLLKMLSFCLCISLTVALACVVDMQNTEFGRWLQSLKLLIPLSLCMLMICGGRDLRTRTLHHQHHDHIYNRTLARILAEYASAVYMDDLTALMTWTCSRCNGLTKRFQMIELIVDIQNCLQAYVGVAEDLGAIVIAFRGTQENSIQNWAEDLFIKQLDLNYPGMAGSMVHHGFYSAYHNTTLRPLVWDVVQRIQQKNAGLSIMVTGHSMGGALASFCALDLTVNYGANDVQVMTFGQPRIGNSAFSTQYNYFVPKTIRVTHGHDMIPHLPPYYPLFPQRTYHHFPYEVWIHSLGLGSLIFEVERICDDSGEDPSCSRSVSGNSIEDHLEYFGVSMHAESWGSCGIVFQEYQMSMNKGEMDSEIMLSGDLLVPDILPRANGTDGTLQAVDV